MKMTKSAKRQYQPITITLETREDFDELMGILDAYVHMHSMVGMSRMECEKVMMFARDLKKLNDQ